MIFKRAFSRGRARRRGAVASTLVATLSTIALLSFGNALASTVAGYAVKPPSLAREPSMAGVIDATWAKAAKVPVSFDFTFQRPGLPTTAYIAQDPTGLDVAFAATQAIPTTAVQETDGAGVLNDDNVTVVLWPQGVQGFTYTFTANTRGARYQTSSENSAYAPDWTAAARRNVDGYVVTMHIPFDIIKAGSSHAWKVQFERTIIATNSEQVWEHRDGQRNAGDPAYAGSLTDIAPQQTHSMSRPLPRLQMYALGEFSPARDGGSTSRAGLDVSVPVTPTSAFVATLHPDYSNVETDQQTIAPAAFPRYYSEVRPFFTQVGSDFNYHFSCTNCPTTLYTPAIPSFRQGYAYEGSAGPLTFGAFDAIGANRNDSAQAVNYSFSTQRDSVGADIQRVAVDAPGFSDITTTLATGYSNQHSHLFTYLNYGMDRGTSVTAPDLANYLEYGVGKASRTTTAVLSFQRVGAQFLPADGYVSQPDIAGYLAYYAKTYNFSPQRRIRDISVSASEGRYTDRFGQLAQSTSSVQVGADLRNELSINLQSQQSSIRTSNGELLPFTLSGISLTFKGQTSTPTSISYNQGPYFHGRLTSWSYQASLPLYRTVRVTLETDENSYESRLAIEPPTRQWLERASLDWQFSRYASIDVGVRRIIGRNLPNSYEVPDYPTAADSCGILNGYLPFDCVQAGNVTAAFHYLHGKNEVYVTYGDPNSLITTPAVYLKWIRYVGAQKGA